MAETTPELVVKVKRCARCRGDHEALLFQKLTHSMAPENCDHEWTHWALCPTNGEPIMLLQEPT